MIINFGSVDVEQNFMKIPIIFHFKNLIVVPMKSGKLKAKFMMVKSVTGENVCGSSCNPNS
jgi:hypothetical protein